MSVRIKICGITCLMDAVNAIDAGASALGFVFYPPSPRYISPDKAGKIIRQLPPFVTTCGLFVDYDAQSIDQIIQRSGIDLLQFHGHERAAFCTQFSRPYIKAIRVKEDTDLYQAGKTYATARALLLDAYVKGIPGGTGESFNWSWIPKDLSTPIILAGGLNPDNITNAIEQVRPYAVDVSGGVEKAPGIKDAECIRRFCHAVLSYHEN